ncbi:hypothetical protein Tco_1026647, partial [Tanacetum coccineum]
AEGTSAESIVSFPKSRVSENLKSRYNNMALCELKVDGDLIVVLLWILRCSLDPSSPNLSIHELAVLVIEHPVK